MYFACYSRLALGIALPSLALYLTPRTTTPEGKEAEPKTSSPARVKSSVANE
jgi:hypothetical protein